MALEQIKNSANSILNEENHIQMTSLIIGLDVME